MEEVDKLISILSPIEREVLPHLSIGEESKIASESGMDVAKVKRALAYLDNKGVIKMRFEEKRMIVLGDNGHLYIKNELPERRLLIALSRKKQLSMQDAKKEAKLSDNEVSVALGTLKKKALMEFKQGKMTLNASNKEILKPFLEEIFLKSLPKPFSDLKPEEKLALENLKKRRDIVKVEEVKHSAYEITSLGKKLLKNLNKVKAYSKNTIEVLNSDMLKTGSWKGKEFRHYDIKTGAPKLHGGKRHFMNQSIQYARKIWMDMGFQEMEGDIINTAFWDFDSLFVPQDHPAREMQDTFFLKEKGKLPDKKLVQAVKAVHETGGKTGSKGWQYEWDEEKAKRLVLRTHTTVLSAKTLTNLKKSEWPAKFFTVGRNYRNETIDWKHSFEFNQTEGIVVDPNATFRDLLGYLKQFFTKMGYPQARFRPSYFPYTEPSIEIDVFHPIRKEWVELGGAGIFRPEVSEALLGEKVPILAWGPGFDRIMLEYYKIKDLREIYSNNINQLRNMKFWIK
ncbi:phenylalanine--tRNA ligase subunit alpha [Nanoarchaeota archaeon]